LYQDIITRCGDTYNVSSVSLNREDNDRARDCAHNCANRPEQRLAVQHLAEGLARLVPQVQALSELGAAGAVDAANVFNVSVDAGAEWRSLRERGDAAGCGDFQDAQDVNDDEFDANGKEHSGRGHGEDADGRVVGTCAAGCVLVKAGER
jgi:hypothetical protein